MAINKTTLYSTGLGESVSDGKGGLLVNGSVIYVDTIADLQALPTSELVDGQQIDVLGSSFKWDSAAGVFTSQNTLNVRAFGALGDGVNDDAPAFLAAMKHAGRDGRKIVVPSGTYFFGSTVVLNNANLGFNWRNLIIEGEASSSPYQGGGGYTNTAIRTDGYSAFEIHLEDYGHERILVEKLAFLNDSGAARVGTRAIDIVVDGSRSFNYPVGWFLDELSCENYEALVRTRHINIADQNDRFIGRFIMNRIHTWNTDYVIDVDGSYLNLFSGYDWRCHNTGKVRIGATSGGHFMLTNCHWESADPSVLEIDAGALGSFISFHNYDGEKNGDRSMVGSAPYPNGLVTFINGGKPSNLHKIIFTGFCRLPSFGEGPVEVPYVELAAYTTNSISIIPKGTIIRTPESVKIEAPSSMASASERHFRFMVPLDVAKGYSNYKEVDVLVSGHRGVFSTPVPIEKSQQFPGYRAQDVNVYRHTQGHANPNSKRLFAASWVMDMDRNTTRFDNPLAFNISGSELSVFLNSELADEPCVCVFGVLLDPTTETLDALLIAPENPGSNHIMSPGSGSWYDALQPAYDYLIPQGLGQSIELVAPAGGSVEVPVYARNDSDPADTGLVGKLTIAVDGGLLGSAEYLFRVSAAGRSNTELYNDSAASITIAASYTSSFQAFGVNVDNTSGTAAAVSARLEWL